MVIEETLRNFEMRLVDSGFEVFYEGAVRPLPEISMDPDAVSQAILNLLDNAVKYSGEGRRVFVRLERDQDTAVISVRDEGIGISPDEQKKVFDRFHRVGTGLVHDVKGSGLGLAIVNHIAAAHGGSVELSSEPGRGSTFSIRLPIGIKGSRELSGLAAV